MNRSYTTGIVSGHPWEDNDVNISKGVKRLADQGHLRNKQDGGLGLRVRLESNSQNSVLGDSQKDVAMKKMVLTSKHNSPRSVVRIQENREDPATVILSQVEKSGQSEHSALAKQMGAIRLNDCTTQRTTPYSRSAPSSQPIVNNAEEDYRVKKIRRSFLAPDGIALEYEDAILLSCQRTEESALPPQRGYMSLMKHVTRSHREALIGWLVDTHYMWKLSQETLFLTVSFMDRFMLKKALVLTTQYLQLTGAICLNICSKYEDVEPFCLKDVHELRPHWSAEDIALFESALLTDMDFHVGVPTPLFFLKHYVRMVARDEEFCATEAVLAEYLITLALHCADLYTDYNPSIVAAAALYLSRRRFGAKPLWPDRLRIATDFTPDHCVVNMLYELWKTTKDSNKREIAYRKFSSKSYLNVALLDCDPTMRN